MSLSDEEIGRLAEVLGDRRNKKDDGFRKLVDGLLILGIASLVAVVWNLSNTVSVLTTQVSYISLEVQALRHTVIDKQP